MADLGHAAIALGAMLLCSAAGAQTLSRSAFDAQTAGAGAGEINCTIKPSQVVELSAALAGRVDKVLVAPGQQVNFGDPLVQLDDSVARGDLRLSQLRADSSAPLQRAQAAVAALGKTAERLRRANKRRAVSDAELEAAERDLALANADLVIEEERRAFATAELERAELTVAQHQVFAPVSGVIGEDLIHPGETTLQRPVATIYVNQPLRVEAFVPAARLAGFLARGSYEAVINANAANPVSVTLDYAAPQADLASNTISVFFILQDVDVLPGSNCVMPEGQS